MCSSSSSKAGKKIFVACGFPLFSSNGWRFISSAVKEIFVVVGILLNFYGEILL